MSRPAAAPDDGDHQEGPQRTVQMHAPIMITTIMIIIINIHLSITKLLLLLLIIIIQIISITLTITIMINHAVIVGWANNHFNSLHFNSSLGTKTNT